MDEALLSERLELACHIDTESQLALECQRPAVRRIGRQSMPVHFVNALSQCAVGIIGPRDARVPEIKVGHHDIVENDRPRMVPEQFVHMNVRLLVIHAIQDTVVLTQGAVLLEVAHAH